MVCQLLQIADKGSEVTPALGRGLPIAWAVKGHQVNAQLIQHRLCTGRARVCREELHPGDSQLGAVQQPTQLCLHTLYAGQMQPGYAATAGELGRELYSSRPGSSKPSLCRASGTMKLPTGLHNIHLALSAQSLKRVHSWKASLG